ncbi:PIR Superfamily Protein [Plasmodium ovale curtisi]|uniref:PIR Superfamily Protein n=1 Tax=Plasmodium ovale curtisi TaxID=864141 RepID=A0A1A8WJU8_PLAOA|nr:PIR Superfamily Protein [Plasmodium ovale curtisi]
MPENSKDADLEFFNKLTKDTFRTNKELEEYYNKIESIYKSKLNIILEKDVEIEDHGATDDDQGAESDISPHDDQTYIFSSKFANALVKLIDHYDDSSLIQHDHSKQCVYFKYWFYDKILKNIFSNVKLEDFYKEIEDGDKEDESASESESESEKELIDGRLIDSDEEDIEVSEYVQKGEILHRSKGKYYNSKKILLALGNPKICNIYKLKLDQIKNIKLLYDYLEDDKSKNSNFIEEIRKSAYCKFFNKTIELYNNKSKCKSDNLDNEYCQELEKCKEIYSRENINILECSKSESSSDTPHQSAVDTELQEEQPDLLTPGHEAGSSPSAGLSNTDPEILKGVGFTYFLIPTVPTEQGSTVSHNGNNMNERQTIGDGRDNTASYHPNTQSVSSDDIIGSHSMDSEASTSCHHGSVGGSCESPLQQLSEVSTGSRTKLNIGEQENTENHAETQVGLKEETGNTNTIVSSASTVLGVSALAFMLYKFTPLGSLINNRRGGMDTWDINEEGYDENLLFSSALGNTNSNNNNYSIGYYSLGNT